MIYDSLDSISNQIRKKIDENENVIFLLQGPLGIGKTTLIKNVLSDIDKNIMVTSPTYNIMHQYNDYIFHYDLYMKDLEHLLNMGILDLLSTNGIHFVEWGDKILLDILKKSGLCTYMIKIKHSDNNQYIRFYEIIEE